MKNKILSLIFGIFLVLSLISLVSSLTIESVTTSPPEIEPGENAEIRLSVENNLEDDVTDVSISLDLTDIPIAPYQSGTEKSFDEIGDGKTKEVRFNVIALSDAESGTYKIPVTISYVDIDDEKITKTSQISLVINSAPNLNIDYEGNLIKGRNNELIIRIVNSGLSEVKLLSLNVKDISGLRVLSLKNIYIGNIESDDFDTAIFQVFVDDRAGILNLPVELNYRDSLNNIHAETEILSLKAYTEEEAVELGLINKSRVASVVVGVIVLIVLYITYRKIRRRLKKRKKDK